MNVNTRKIVTFGELMLRLTPPGYLRFTQAELFEVCYGGAEANVAVSLAQFGENVSYVTKLPEHALGTAAVNSLRRYGVDTRNIVRGDERIGIYFYEKGNSQRASNVLYDRRKSAIATASEKDFDWARIFDDCQWFHFTGITPALSNEIAEICLRACEEAKRRGIIISCDLNYRNKLWSKATARQVMSELCRYVDVCIANEEDADDVFGIKASGANSTFGQLNKDGYKEVVETLTERFNFKYTAITLRTSISASDNKWSAILYDGKAIYYSKEYSIHIVDRLGGGDSFSAGIIYAILNGYGMQKTVEFATAASCLKHTIEGDYNVISVDEVFKLMDGDGAGRVVR
jgi:2-dehydro-3-deoxygluconokinase